MFMRVTWPLVTMAAGVASVLLISTAASFALRRPSVQVLNVRIASAFQVDYSTDHPVSIEPLNPDVIQDVLRDAARGATITFLAPTLTPEASLPVDAQVQSLTSGSMTPSAAANLNDPAGVPQGSGSGAPGGAPPTGQLPAPINVPPPVVDNAAPNTQPSALPPGGGLPPQTLPSLPPQVILPQVPQVQIPQVNLPPVPVQLPPQVQLPQLPPQAQLPQQPSVKLPAVPGLTH
jgi:hypothetical protein